MQDLNDVVLAWARGGGWLGLVLAMTVENLVQFVPSLAILPLAGHLSAQGVISLPLAMAACTAGSLLGCLIWYGLGRLDRALATAQHPQQCPADDDHSPAIDGCAPARRPAAGSPAGSRHWHLGLAGPQQ